MTRKALCDSGHDQSSWKPCRHHAAKCIRQQAGNSADYLCLSAHMLICIHCWISAYPTKPDNSLHVSHWAVPLPPSMGVRAGTKQSSPHQASYKCSTWCDSRCNLCALQHAALSLIPAVVFLKLTQAGKAWSCFEVLSSHTMSEAIQSRNLSRSQPWGHA